MVQIKGALRRRLKGEAERPIANWIGSDRETARRYINGAMILGLDRSGGEEQLADELIGQMVERVRPDGPDATETRGGFCSPRITSSPSGGRLSVVKIGILFHRRGIEVP